MGAIRRGGAHYVWSAAIVAVSVCVPLTSVNSGEGDAAPARQPTVIDRLAYDTLQALQSSGDGNPRVAAAAVVKSATDGLFPELWADSPDWLKRFEFQWEWNEKDKPDFSILTVQPLYQSTDRRNTVFTQVRLTRNHQFGNNRVTTNFGVGYRRLLLDNTVLAGVNGFLDREWEVGHDRLGAGVELKWHAFDLAFNYYEAFGGRELASPGNRETALDGYNVEITAQIPYLPWARARFSVFEFFLPDSSDDLNGYTAGLEMDLHQNVQVEFGFTDDDRNENLAFVRLNIRLGDGLSTGPKGRYMLGANPVDDVAFNMRDMRAHTLDKVRRIDTIAVERVSSGVVITRAN